MPHVNPVRQPGIVRAADASVTVTQDAAGYLLSAAGSPDNADGLIAARTFLPHNEYLPHANALTWSGAQTFSKAIAIAATSNQIVMQSAGVTGTLTWTPATSNKVITLPNVTGTVVLGLGSASGVAYWSAANVLTFDANIQFDGYQILLPVQGSGGGIVVGTDVQLYRSAANTWRTPDALTVDGLITASAGLDAAASTFIDALTDGSGGGLRAGAATDVLLYRGAANTWYTGTSDGLYIDQANLTLATGADAGSFLITGNAASNRSMNFQTGGVNRWLFRANSTAESGSNAGSNFVINARADDGSNIGDAIFLHRATRAFGIADGITAPTAIAGYAFIYVDTADGDLKVRFGDGTTKTLATDT